MKISILTPSYNSEKYIERAINCVLDQDYPDFEHIVVDGNSTDNTVEILQKYPHLRWVSEKDRGQSDAMNKAFNMSTGEIIVYLNADDEFSPGVFKTVAGFFQGNPSKDLVVGDLMVDFGYKKDIVSSPIEYHKILLHFKYPFPYNPVAYFYRRKVQEELGPFSLDNHYAMDYEFLLRAFANYEIGKVDKVFGIFNNFRDNKTSTIDPVQLCHSTALNDLYKYNKSFLLYYYAKWLKYRYYKPFKAKVFKQKTV